MASFRIHAPSDTAPQPRFWRDARVKDQLSRAIQRVRGDIPQYEDADVEVYLWGWTTQEIDPSKVNVLWVIGHPDLLLSHSSELRNIPWRNVFCASKRFCSKVEAALGVKNVEYLPCPAPYRESSPPPSRIEFDLSFIGNKDPAKNRHLMEKAFEEFPSLVYGPGWEELGRGEYIDWRDFPSVWNNSLITPYTHHKDMAREGFVADAALDAIVHSNALLISDFNRGFDDLGFDHIPNFDGEDYPLCEMIKHFKKNPSQRGDLVEKMREVAREWTYSKVAGMIL